MMPDTDIDTRLVAAFDGPPLDDEPFKSRVRSAVRRRAKRRRAMLGAALGASLSFLVVEAALGPAWMPPVAILTPLDSMATLVLAAACCGVWVATTSPDASRRLVAGSASRVR